MLAVSFIFANEEAITRTSVLKIFGMPQPY
jgi:hypothetical protein